MINLPREAPAGNVVRGYITAISKRSKKSIQYNNHKKTDRKV